MSVDFLTELENSLAGWLYVNTGRSKVLKRDCGSANGASANHHVNGEIHKPPIEEDTVGREAASAIATASSRSHEEN